MFPQKAKSLFFYLFLVLNFGCKNMQPTAMDPMEMMPTGPDVPRDGMWHSIGPYGIDVTALAVLSIAAQCCHDRDEYGGNL